VNISGSISKISVIFLVLISNAVSFGMMTIASLPKPHYKKNPSDRFKAQQAAGFKRLQGRLKDDKDKSTKWNKCLDTLYDELIPSLEITISDKKIDHLPRYDQLNILSALYSNEQEGLIDARNLHRRIALLYLPPDEAKLRIFSEFRKMEKQLGKNENNSLDDLRHIYKIDSEVWEASLAMSYAIHTLRLESMKQKHTNTIQDHRLPKNWLDILENAMQEYNLEPSAFNGMLIEDDPSTVASYEPCKMGINKFATGLRVLSFLRGKLDLKKESVVVFRVDGASIIKFNPNKNWGGNHDFILKHIAHHELTHGLRGHAIKFILAVSAVSRKTGLDEEKITQHPAFVKLLLAHEISADALCALKSPELARCAKKSPNLYAGSYNFISMAHTNWKVLKLLEERERQALEKEKEPYRTFLKAITANYQRELEAHKKEQSIIIPPQSAAKASWCTLF